MTVSEMQAEFLRQQNELRGRIEPVDRFAIGSVRLVAGVDLAYWNSGDAEYAVCCIVIIDAETKEVLEKQHCSGKIEVPYMPGFLAFRELPLILKTVGMLRSDPDLFVFDGNGYLHPRHMGIATHASFSLQKPTVGIAKTYFRVDQKTDYKSPKTKRAAIRILSSTVRCTAERCGHRRMSGRFLSRSETSFLWIQPAHSP